MDGKLLSGQMLQPEQTLVSAGGQARLHYQNDGNLVVYLNGKPFWASHTDGKTAGRLKMQRGGNLVLYDATKPIASTRTHGHPGAMVQLQDDGNFVIYEDPSGPLAGTPIWASSTHSFVPVTADDATLEPKEPHVRARPLVGPLRVQNKLFRDDTGYRRVFFCSWFPALRILRDNPVEFERQIDAIAAAGWQGFRTFFAVGGWSPYWDEREVAPVTYQKWFHSSASGLMRPASFSYMVNAWPNYDNLLRTLLRACRERGLRLHQAVGDMQIICPSGERELALNRHLADICAEEGGLEVMALVGDTNEYPQNRYASDAPESIAQMGRVLQVWKDAIPGVLTTMGAAISEEPERLFQSIEHGDVCAVHTSRGTPMALKRTHALVHWEGQYRSFPKPFWQGEPIGWGQAVSVDRITDNAYGVALYAMHALTGQASVYFNGPAIHSREPLESTWGFSELPRLFAELLPEDLATWDHGNNGRGIEYWWKGTHFITSTFKDWDPSPPRPIDTWTLYTGDRVTSGIGTPPRVTGLLVGRFQ